MKKQLQATLILIFANLLVAAQNIPVRIDTLLKAYVAVDQFNGSALVIQNGKKLYEKSFGYQNAIIKSPLTKHSIFPIASLTKPFTALIILKLVEDKKIFLNDPLSKYIPGFARGNDIQIKNLLTHTAGLYESLRNPKYLEQVASNRAFSPDEKMAYFKDEPLDFEPGTKFNYTNSGYDLLGIIIEKVTGLSYSAAVRKFIFKPLSMNNSGFNFALLKDSHKVSGYSFISPHKQIKLKFWNATLTYASGGLYSTIGDLNNFYQGLSEFKIISQSTFKQATTPFLEGYGYGWFVDSIANDRVIDHGGNIPGATSYFLMMPEQKICIILLNNMTSTVLEKIGNTIYLAVQNKPYSIPKPKIEIQLAVTKLHKYAGLYDVNTNYKLRIFESAGGLFMRVNNQDQVKLRPESEKVFFIKDDDRVLEFVFKDDKVVQVKIKQGLGTKVGDKTD